MIITIDEYKAMAGLKDSSADSQIEALIPLVEDDYLAIRGKPWDRSEDGSIAYPAGCKIPREVVDRILPDPCLLEENACTLCNTRRP